MADQSNGGRRKASDKAAANINIREMELEDLPTVFEIGEDLFTPDRWPNLYRTWDVYELVDLFASDGEFCLVAEQDEGVVGFVMGSLIEKRKSAWKYGYVEWLGTTPELAGRGIARRLLARLTDLFIEAGARMMLVDTDAENERAVEFFERSGFTHPVEHVFMSKNLTVLPKYQKRREKEEGETRPRPGRSSALHVGPRQTGTSVKNSGE